MDAHIGRRPFAAVAVAAIYIASALAFGSLSGTSGATTEDVATEAEYRDALFDFSLDPAGPHTINIVADFTITDPTSAGDPTYPGAQPLTIDGNGHTVDSGVADTRFLHHDSSADLTIQNLTVTGFQREDDGGAVRTSSGDVTIQNSTLSGNTAIDDNGGAVRTAGGDVTIQNSTLSDNTAIDGNGGAVRTSTGDVTIQNSTLSDNTAIDGDGGAVRTSGGDVTIQNSTLSGNTAGSNGGAVRTATGDVTIQNSTLSGNTAGSDGGAVRTDTGDVTIQNSTLSDNTADFDGGAVRTSSFGEVSLIHATVVGNAATTGANIFLDDLNSFGSVVADPQGGGANCDIEGATTSTYSYEEDDDSCGFTHATDTENGPDPELGPLANNGGPTQTMLPQPGSPLIDAIPEEDCELDTDQRGVSRPQDGNDDGVLACDIGAVEVQPAEEAPPARPMEEDPTFTG